MLILSPLVERTLFFKRSLACFCNSFPFRSLLQAQQNRQFLTVEFSGSTFEFWLKAIFDFSIFLIMIIGEGDAGLLQDSPLFFAYSRGKGKARFIRGSRRALLIFGKISLTLVPKALAILALMQGFGFIEPFSIFEIYAWVQPILLANVAWVTPFLTLAFLNRGFFIFLLQHRFKNCQVLS